MWDLVVDLVSVVILVPTVQDIRVDPMDMAMAEVVGAKVVEPKVVEPEVVEAVAEVVEAKMLQVKVVVGEDTEVEEARGLGVDTIHIHDKW